MRREMRYAAIVVPALAASPALGAISYISQERVVHASFFDPTPVPMSGSQTVIAPDFGEFNGGAMVTGAVATQWSRLENLAIQGSGTAWIGYLGQGSFTEAYSKMIVQFEIDAAVPFTFSGIKHPTLTQISLTGGSLDLNFAGQEEFEVSGSLKPGTYVLDVFSDATLNSSSIFDFSLVIVPGPGSIALLGAAVLMVRRPRRR